MKTLPLLAGALLAMPLTSANLHAQSFTLEWFTIDGGGGTSTGGVYSVSGTIGQPDAGVLRGGPYSLMGGFWGAFQTPGAPSLSVEQIGNSLRVYWPLPASGFVLEQTTTLTTLAASPTILWMQVSSPYQTNTTHISITVPIPSGHRFYRLRKP